MKSFSRPLFAALICSALCAPFGNANAAGFYIQEQSVSGLGSSFAGSVTNLNDASTVYYNPAGMTKLDGSHGQLGVHLLIPSSDLTNTGSTAPAGGTAISGGNPYDPTPVPNGYVSHQLNDKTWVGLGISAPFGLANEYNDGWFGRYDSTKTELTVLDIQPTIAFKISDKLSIGGGLNIQHADAELKSTVFGGTEGTSTLKGDDYSYGYNIGLQYQPDAKTTLGANYRSAVSHKLDGRVIIVNSTALDRNDTASANLNLPDIATFGASHKLNDKWTIMGQATWFGWNNFQDIDAQPDAGTEIDPIIQNYQTTWAFALGAEYDYNDAWTLRGGVQYDETPTTDEYRTSRTPDGDRIWGSVGATYKWNEKIDLDMAATYIDISDESINVSRNGGLASLQANSEGHVGILAIGLNYKF